MLAVYAVSKSLLSPTPYQCVSEVDVCQCLLMLNEAASRDTKMAIVRQYKRGAGESPLLSGGAERLNCNRHTLILERTFHCFLFLNLFFFTSHLFFIFLRARMRVCMFTPFALHCVNISAHDKGAEGARWLLRMSVLEADTAGNK